MLLPNIHPMLYSQVINSLDVLFAYLCIYSDTVHSIETITHCNDVKIAGQHKYVMPKRILDIHAKDGLDLEILFKYLCSSQAHCEQEMPRFESG
jgi:hypothetical protein